MARQVLPIVGAVVGAYFGNPQLGFAIGSLIGNAVDPQVIKGPKLGEAGIQTSAEGVFRPIVYGTGPVKGNIIERGNRQIKVKREKQGKGGPVTETERVYWTFAIRIAEGPIAGVTRIWMDEKLVYDVTPSSTIQDETEEFGEKLRIYLGDEEQLPDPDLEAYKGVGNVNAYRGTAYIVFPNYDLTDYAERIPDFRFEVVANVDIVSSDIIAIGAINNTFQRQTAVSGNGTAWPETVNDAISSTQYIMGVGGRAIIHSPLGASYSDDYGVNWIDSVGGGSAAGGAVGASSGSVVLIPNGIDGMQRSTDAGETFTQLIYPAYPRSNYISMNETMAINASVYSSNFTRSTDEGLTWTLGGLHDLTFSFGGDTINSADTFVFGGANTESRPAIVFTEDGLSSTEVQIGSAPGYVVSLAYGRLFNQDVWVVATSDGNLYRSFDLISWTVSPTPFPATALIFTGSGFIAGGDVEGDGFIAASSNGLDFTEVDQPFDYTVFRFANLRSTIAAERIQLKDIVADLHSRIGHDEERYDVAELVDYVDGLVLAGDYNAADAIRTLMPVYMYDAAEADIGSGYRINYVKRGKPVQLTLTYDDLVEAPEETKREDALERPRVLHMHFENPLIGYAPAKASPKRNSPDLKVVGEISTSIPVVFSDVDEAWRTADKMLKVAWAEVGGEQSLSVPMSLLRLIPTDTVGLSLRNQVRRLRITQSEFAGGIAPLTLVADRQSAYTSNLTGVPLPEPTPPPPSIVGPTVFEFLDIPALTDTNDRLLYYVAASGQTPAWYGALVQRSLDGGANFDDATTFRQNTIMGVLVADVPAASEFYTDTTNVVSVQLYTDEEIDSLTTQQFLSEGGSFAVERPDGTWEVMQYRDAEQDSTGVYALSYLARGRLNTGGHAHLAGASVVFLDGVRSVDALTAWIDEDLTHRAVSLGRSPEGAAQFTDTYTAQSQTEFPVAHLFGEIDSASLVLTAVPRHRFGTEDHPVQSINHDGYRWSATDGVNVLAADTDAPAHTFDVSGWATPITATVSQLNRYTGAGPAVTEDFE